MARISDYLSPYKIRCVDNLSEPILLTYVEGTPGTTELKYAVSFTTIVGETLPSIVGVVTNGPDTLNGFNKVKLSVADIPARVLKVRFWKDEWSYATQTLRQNSASYSLGVYMALSEDADIRYECTGAGTSNISDPGSWPTEIGETKTDGSVTWTVRTNIVTNWRKLGEVDPSPGQLYDTGQATTAATLPTANTSGRPGVIAIGCKPGTLVQRMTWGDIQGVLSSALQDLGDAFMKDGDVRSGCSERFVSGTTWDFAAGKIYFLGRFLPVPSGQVTLTGTGNEVVGLSVTPYYSTPDDDIVQRASLDEGVNPLYGATGPDWLYLNLSWVVDQPGQIPIKEFVNNVPKVATISAERSTLDSSLAERSFDTSGSFVVRNFPLKMVDHYSDSTKMQLQISPGKAYPNGFCVKTDVTRPVNVDKAREVREENNSGVSVFSNIGGYIVSSNTETFNVDNKKVKLKFGPNGNSYTVTLSGTTATAAEIKTQIESYINAFPTSVPLVSCAASEGVLGIMALNSKTLIVEPVTGDAYTELGIATGSYYSTGTRIYRTNNSFVKDVSDMNYKVRRVDQITHNLSTNIDLLPKSNVVSILGASDLEANAYDGIYDYEAGVDFVQDGNNISFVGMGGTPPGSGSIYYVVYEYNHNAVKGARIRGRVTDAQITKGLEDGTDDLVFTGATSITRVSDGTAITGLSGSARDVINILRVNTTAGQTTDQYSLYSLLKNSDALSHNVSQLDWSAAGAPGDLGEGQPSVGNPYRVTFDFWYHSTEGDYVTADSYDIYEDIESYGGQNLRDAVDFREFVYGEGTKNWPVHNENPTFDYSFYLARADKLALDDQGNFYILRGNPDVIPPIPQDQVSLLTLAVLRINPYTYDTSDCTVISTEPTRLTQNQLREMYNRLERLEYWSVVNAWEKEAAGHSIAADSTGLFTDSITGFGKMSLSFNKGGIRHTAAVDLNLREIRLPAAQTVKELEIDEVESDNVRRAGSTLILDYVPELIISQTKASKTINVNPDNVFSFANGTATLTPSTDVFMDTEQAPQLNVDFDNNLAPLIQEIINSDPVLSAQYNNTIWDNWHLASAQEVAQARAQGTWNAVGHTDEEARARGFSGWQDVGIEAAFARSGSVTSLRPDRVMQDLGDRVVDLSIVPMMRTTLSDGSPFLIHIRCNGLMPNADHACSIDGQVIPFTYDSGADNPKGSAGTHTYQGISTVKADSTGALTGVFTMPNGITTGDKPVTVFHYSDPDSSTARAMFFGQGFRQTTQNTTVGFTTLTQRTGPMGETVEVAQAWGDPLAYSFLIENRMEYVSEIGVFFATASNTMPVTCDIREMINGYPSRKVLATCTIEAEDVNVSADGSVETRFIFDEILGYKPGEYCFVLISNSDEYTVFCCEVGDTDILTSESIPTQPYGGVLFHSPNNSTWAAMTKHDLKFNMYKSNFVDNCAIVFTNLTGIQANLFALRIDEFLAPGTNVKWAYRPDNGSAWYPFHPQLNTDLGAVISQVQLRCDITSLGGSYALVEKFAGIALLYHDATANCIWNDQIFSDPLNYPNKISAMFDVVADGVNGVGTTTVYPYYSIDDGETWVELAVPSGYLPVLQNDPFYRYQFETPGEASISGATNATPIVITSTGHGFKNNAIVDIASVGGNTAANGAWRVTAATADTFELVNPDTGADSVGSGAYTSGGTINLAEFGQMRPRMYLATSNRARSPRIRNVAFVCSRV
jgi:hypothetical protein